MTNVNKIIDFTINKCKENNIENIKLYLYNSTSTSLSMKGEEIKKFQNSNDIGINISGNYNGFYSECYFEKLDQESAIEAIENLKIVAEFNGKKAILTNKISKSIISENARFPKADINNVIEKIKKTQLNIKPNDDVNVSFEGISFREQLVDIFLIAEDKTQLYDSYSYVEGGVSVIASKSNVMKNWYSDDIKNFFEDIDYDYLLSNAIQNATQMIEATPIKSDNYNIILKNEVAADLFQCALSIFTSDAVKNKSSKLGNKIDQLIASSKLTVIEDPTYILGKHKRTFDDDGNKTYKKAIIENGILKNILSTNKNGNSTSNAFRQSYKSNIATNSINCYIEESETSFDDMLKSQKECVVITKFDGLNAGFNATTGDFSFISNGYLSNSGKFIKAINQITVAGNFYEMLNEIETIANDAVAVSSGISFFKSPSILIKNLMIGGL